MKTLGQEGCAPRTSANFRAIAVVGPLTAGRSWFYPFGFRDNVPGGSGSNLSGAIEVTYLP